ncbi:MAG: lipopolysaccharide heptosyltransferase II [Tildeniella nuda ZEHNDER 1965/U140]|jgi:lipopolysaccharide heptosyltransferase II|nr:lipopolysaccharide heptosyltransferase II [Tildeniella nuda ZEHNDER 1965/U140]
MILQNTLLEENTVVEEHTVVEEQWQQAKKILCIRLDAIGDVLMTTPAIRALKQGDPNRHITLLTSYSGADVAALVPEIDRVITYDPPWMKATAPRLNSRPELAMVEALRQEAFDAAVIFTVFSQNPLPSALLCYLADIPLRLAHCHENPYQLLTDWVLDPEPSSGIRHEVRRQLDLVASLGFHIEDECLSLHVTESNHQRLLQRLQLLELDIKQPWVVIHPGATAASRRYPAEGFAAVARRLVLDANCQVLFTGTEPERELVAAIQAAMGVASASLVGELDLAEMAALLAIAPLLIANNTGPAHIAAAVSTPVVDLYALTNPQHTPWGVPNRVLFHDVPCKFCYKSICPEGHHHCLQLVSPDDVFRAACELMADTVNPSIASPLELVPSALPLLTLANVDDRQSTTLTPSAREVWR